LLSRALGVLVLKVTISFGDHARFAPQEVNASDRGTANADHVHLEFRRWEPMLVEEDAGGRFQRGLGARIAEGDDLPGLLDARPALTVAGNAGEVFFADRLVAESRIRSHHALDERR
jgi:hypothetical protein